MADLLTSGTRVGDRFVIEGLLSQRNLGDIYRARDLSSGEQCVLKVFHRDLDEHVLRYAAYLTRISKHVREESSPGVAVPFAVGQTDRYIYLAFEYLEGAKNLHALTRGVHDLAPATALRILRKLAAALFPLHQHQVIHGDIKPTNILVAGQPDDPAVYLIDFGMIEAADGEPGLMVSTYSYMHPSLTRNRLADRHDARAKQNLTVGPFIDIYALGLVALQLLVRNTHIQRPLSRDVLMARLRSSNRHLLLTPDETLRELAELILEMLNIEPANPRPTAVEVAERIDHLITAFGKNLPSQLPDRAEPENRPLADDINKTDVSEPPVKIQQDPGRLMSDVVQQLKQIEETIGEVTMAFVVDESIDITQRRRTELLDQVDDVFSNALSRTRSAWRTSVIMTMTAFVLIVAMGGTAAVLTALVGASYWSLVFGGGVTGATFIGTLMWKPYDRMFRATIIAQQVEMIHLQTVAGLELASSFDERMRVFREAQVALEALFKNHAND